MRPGQSRWPEPGAVRALLNLPAAVDDSDQQHKKTVGANGRDFPRADLGLPILFQNMGPGNSSTPTVEGATKGATRLASPVILKALPLNNSKAVPLVVLLNAPHVWHPDAPGVQLKAGSRTPVSLDVGSMDVPEDPNWPWTNKPPQVDGKASARDAFMAYVEHDLKWGRGLP